MVPYTPKRFDVPEAQSVDPRRLGWPTDEEADEESGLGCNRHYQDLRYVDWDEVAAMIKVEGALLARIEHSTDWEDEAANIDEELEEDLEREDFHPLWGLDLGVGSAVAALSAFGCVPFTSCNGGAFGGEHLERYPLVAFYMRPTHLEGIAAAAAEVGAGLYEHGGSVQVFGETVHKLFDFARRLHARAQHTT